MKILFELVVMSGVVMTTAFPAMAQHDQQQMPMTGQGTMGEGGMMGRGGMMGKDGQGAMMGRGMKDKSEMSGDCPMMGGMMGKGGMGGMMGKGGMGSMMMHSVPMMEGRLAYTKAELEITEAQTPVWDAYADAFRARHTTMESMHADMMKAKESGSALERMDARIKAMESMVGSLKALKSPTEALYAVLTDEQKKKANQLLGGRCGMM